MLFTKIPLEVEAVQYQQGDEPALRVCTQMCFPFTPGAVFDPRAHIHLTDGSPQPIRPGDWIITEGESSYVCPKDLFPTLYQPVVQPEPIQGSRIAEVVVDIDDATSIDED